MTRRWPTAESPPRQAHAQDFAARLIASSLDGILAFDEEFRYTAWNAAMEQVSGLPADRVLGRVAFEVFPFLVETGEDWYFREALAGRTAISRDRAYRIAESGRSGAFEGHYSPVHDDKGRVIGGIAVIRDVTERVRSEQERIALARSEAARTEAEAAARRFAFLAEAGEALAASLDYEQTLQRVAELAVPTLGDFCILDLVDDGAGIRRVAVSHVDPAKRVLMDELRRRYPPTPGSPQPAARVLRSGEPELLQIVDERVTLAHVRDAGHLQLMQRLGVRSHLALPLVARDSTIGVLSLGVTDSERRYGADDLALARELARRAALAVDNARLYRAAQEELVERRRAEEARRLSEERFRAVMEQSPFSTQLLDPQGFTLRVNRAWEALWGLSADTIADYNVLRDEQLERLGVAPYLRRAFAGEATEIPAVRYDPNVSVPERTRHPDPARWVSAYAYPVKDQAGTVREVVLVHQDTTAQVQAEAALRASEERLRLALSAARMNVWDWDLESDVVACSDDAKQFWGIEVGKAADFVSVVHPDDRDAVTQAFDAALADQGRYHAEYRLRSADGLERWVQSRGRVELDERGKPVRVLGVTLDLTALKAAQRATQVLADAGETLGASLDYRATLAKLVELVVPRLADWCAVDLVNESGELERVAVMHSDPAKVALAQTLFDRYPPSPTAPNGVWHVIRSGKPELVEDIPDELLEANAPADPELLHLLRTLGLRSYVCVPLRTRGETLGALSLVHAESGRRHRPADLELAQELARRAAAAVDNARLYEGLRAADRQKDEFLATLAHELRNPLAPIRTGLEVLRLADSAETLERTREMMDRQLSHMVRLVDDLLDLSRVTRGKVQLHLERVDLWSVVGTAIEASRPLIDAQGHELSVSLPATPIELHADRTRIAQVISNLLNNAAKYTDRGGRIELSARQDGDEVALAVTDTGLGIPKEMLAGVFEMFTQVGRSQERSQGGLGIGLTLVKRLVELHGGRVWAESAGAGQGSKFVVRLPRCAVARRVEPPDPAGPSAVTSAASKGRKVLVVDDNADAAECLALLLRIQGHEVETAESGPEALAVVRAFRPEVAFLDIGLPGMSGYELATRFRSDPELANVRLVAVTGWGAEEDRRSSQAAGFDLHLTKPVDPQEIQALLQAGIPRA